MRRKGIACLLSLLWLSVPQAVAQQYAPVVAVFMMESRGSPLSADELVGLTDYLATRLGEKGRFQIIPRDEIKKRLSQARSDSHRDCVDQSCQIEVGKELAAQFSVSSTISKVGSKCLITAALYDLRKSATIKTASQKKTCKPEDLIEGVEIISDMLERKMAHTQKTHEKTAAVAKRNTTVEPHKTIETARLSKQPESVKQFDAIKQPGPALQPEAKKQPLVAQQQITHPAPLPTHQDSFRSDIPRIFVAAHYAGRTAFWLGHDTSEVYNGFRATLDYRFWGRFVLGVSTSYQVSSSTDYALLDGTLHIGSLFSLGQRWLLMPYLNLGFAMHTPTSGDDDNLFGVTLGGGARLSVMLVSVLGIAADLALNYAPLMEDELAHDFIGINFSTSLVACF